MSYLALIAGVICISWSAIFVRWTDIPGPASAFYRMLIPSLLLIPTWLYDWRTPRVSFRTLAIIATGGLFFALDLAFYNTSIIRTSAANATLLGNQTPIFVGLITLWFIWHYKESRLFHWAMTTFWGLFALIHWFDVRWPTTDFIGPAKNTVPFALFFVVGLLRLRSDRGARS